VTLIVVFGCIGFGILAAAFVFTCGKARDRWWKQQVRSYDDPHHELASLSKNSETPAAT
jgi:hypothetical protein